MHIMKPRGNSDPLKDNAGPVLQALVKLFSTLTLALAALSGNGSFLIAVTGHS